MSIEIRESHWDGPEAAELRRQMDAELHPRYADLFVGRDAPPAVDVAAIVLTLVAFDGELPVGTASLKRTDGFWEVKRVFVAETHRRQNLAARLLTAVEQRAAERGITDLVLQTGLRQPEAIALYEREGWLLIPPFGPYATDTEISRCFAKPLSPLFVAVELPAVGEASTLVPRTVDDLRAFAAAGVDLAVIADDLRQAPPGLARVDAPTLAAFAAPLVPGIGIAPAISTTHTEPFHVSKIVQTLDHASLGRAAWQVAVSTSADEAAFFGRKPAVDDTEAWAEAEEAIEVAERLWDSWEDDAEIRDVATGRFIDRDRVHHIDFEGRFFSVRGPSIVPRSPQGRPPIVVSASSAVSLDVAARRADVIRVAPSAVAEARDAVDAAGRAGLVTVLVDVAAASATLVGQTLATLRHDTGADGVVLVFAETPVDDLAPAIAPFTRATAGTLRDRLGLARPASRYIRTLEGAAL
jgi:alkanesulfonate monooxygenase SsuD/methylene tetrahydromethanopterin reductase-like flavin-dependent oxidoreductase (luciferase family)/GNAT superfamily N-acetyltransferase